MTQQAQAEALRLRLAVTQYTALCKKFGAEGFHFDPRPEDVIAVLDRLQQLEAHQAVPQGWKLVPVEPTEAVEQAAADYLGECVKAHGLWSAMLAAAPTPPTHADIGNPITKRNQEVAPPAQERKPLTDEQIDALWGGENVSVPQLVNRRAISRSIERAHRIQEKPNAPPI